MDQSQQHPHGAEGAQGSTGKLQAEEQLWGSTSCAQAAHSRSGTQRAPNKPTPPGRGHSESPGSPVGLQGEARGSLSHSQMAQSVTPKVLLSHSTALEGSTGRNPAGTGGCSLWDAAGCPGGVLTGSLGAFSWKRGSTCCCPPHSGSSSVFHTLGTLLAGLKDGRGSVLMSQVLLLQTGSFPWERKSWMGNQPASKHVLASL